MDDKSIIHLSTGSYRRTYTYSRPLPPRAGALWSLIEGIKRIHVSAYYACFIHYHAQSHSCGYSVVVHAGYLANMLGDFLLIFFNNRKLTLLRLLQLPKRMDIP